MIRVEVISNMVIDPAKTAEYAELTIKQINEFIKDKKVIDIKFPASGVDELYGLHAVIIYEVEE